MCKTTVDLLFFNFLLKVSSLTPGYFHFIINLLQSSKTKETDYACYG